MIAHNLIITDCGDVTFSSVHKTVEDARFKLAQWSIDNWDNEEEDPGAFSRDEQIDMFFDGGNDYNYSILPVATPEPEGGEDIVLTATMCRIVKESLDNFSFDLVKIILKQEEDEDAEFSSGDISSLIEEISDKF